MISPPKERRRALAFMRKQGDGERAASLAMVTAGPEGRERRGRRR